ncbi:hypothetical protein WDW86_03885 [Bdellovibrionota bacterium FG-2]
MAVAFKEIEVLDDLYTPEGHSQINLKRLATLLDLNDKDIAEAFKIDPTALSKNPYASSNPVLKQWMTIFNLIIRIISEAEPELAPADIKVKMQKWLKLPRPEFKGNSAVDEMRRGKARRVKNLLEQLAG